MDTDGGCSQAARGQLPWSRARTVFQSECCPSGTLSHGKGNPPATASPMFVSTLDALVPQGIGTYMDDRTRSTDSGPALFRPEEAQHLAQQPSFVHYTGTARPSPAALLNPHTSTPSKPWAYACSHPLRALFFEALDTTPWKGWRPCQARSGVCGGMEGPVLRLGMGVGCVPSRECHCCTDQPNPSLQAQLRPGALSTRTHPFACVVCTCQSHRRHPRRAGITGVSGSGGAAAAVRKT